jgi:hypothetical protein
MEIQFADPPLIANRFKHSLPKLMNGEACKNLFVLPVLGMRGTAFGH